MVNVPIVDRRQRGEAALAVFPGLGVEPRQSGGEFYLFGLGDDRLVVVADFVQQCHAGPRPHMVEDGRVQCIRKKSNGRAGEDVAVVGLLQQPRQPLFADGATIDARAAGIRRCICIALGRQDEHCIPVNIEALLQLHDMPQRQHIDLGGLRDNKKCPDGAAGVRPGKLRVRRLGGILDRVGLFEYGQARHRRPGRYACGEACQQYGAHPQAYPPQADAVRYAAAGQVKVIFFRFPAHISVPLN